MMKGEEMLEVPAAGTVSSATLMLTRRVPRRRTD